jgi:hypothetical protein
MTLPLTQQGLFLGSSVILGVLLGLVYDLGRGLRRAHARLTLPVDGLFALLLLLTLLLLGLYTGGLRLYELLGLCLGAGGYFLTLSPLFLALQLWTVRALRRFFARLFTPLKKTMCFLRKVVKKLFPSLKKWGTIEVIPCSPKRKSTPRKGCAIPKDETRSHKASFRAAFHLRSVDLGKSGAHAVRSRTAGTASRRGCGRN